MKKLSIGLSLSLLFFLFILNGLSASAQKLPSKQRVSVWAPGDIKIDGKATEWHDKFEAFNSNNNIFYTVSNDDKSFYIIMNIISFSTINKMYMGGITVSVSSTVAKNDADKLTITYPVIRISNNISIIRAHNAYNKLKNSSEVKKDSINDLISQKNRQFDADYNKLDVEGIKNMDDPIISIYNTEGIKIKAVLDNKFTYTYELVIPLKLLASALNGGDKLKYNIKLNGSKQGVSHRLIIQDMNILYMLNPTDFGGEYVLAKK
jgi:hypothetical protein